MDDVVWMLVLAALSSCSAAPVVSSRAARAATVVDAGSEEKRPAPGDTSAGTLSSATSSNPPVALLPTPPPPPPVAGTKADLPFAACEVGKFCSVQTRGEGDCGTLSLTHDTTHERSPGNVLVLFDQSLSMEERWGKSGTTKLQAAQTAIANAITALQDSLTVGALFFPTYPCSAARPTPPGGAVAPIDGEGQIPFQPATQFLHAWTRHWSRAGRRPGIGTPLQEAFDRADVAITGANLSGSLVVIAVTDGQPNCKPDPKLTMIATASEADHAKRWLGTKAIKTYVVGLPGAAGVQLLSDIAVGGGTMQYLQPDDPQMLQAKLQEVVQDTILTTFQSCSIDLTPATKHPEGLQLRVTEAADGTKHLIPQMQSGGSGWMATPDGSHVDLSGQLCVDAMTGRFRALTLEYPCGGDVPPPEKMPSPQ